MVRCETDEIEQLGTRRRSPSIFCARLGIADPTVSAGRARPAGLGTRSACLPLSRIALRSSDVSSDLEPIEPDVA